MPDDPDRTRTHDHRPDPDATGAHHPAGPTDTFAPPDPDRTTAPGPEAAGRGEGVGAVIAGRYTLVEVIGEGGMGSVYRADQTEPVRRPVALKLIKGGADTAAVLARFDAERQALAVMDHPNIARIYDGGTTPAGRPFFVMELVHGVPLTAYCDDRRLPVRARLELFVQVCQAVQHAHQKGVIHRDLKPGNVLVAEVDGRPTPKVIDFGVAKATGQSLTDLGLADDGAVVGTPAYMSPEQAGASADIDTRTDVYALGVILYELLVGSPPIDAGQFRRAALAEMLRMVREVEPPRPSTKLSTAETRPNIAANRGIEPAQLAKLLRGELDWVVMKCLEKDRGRRYDSANALGRDVARYLADEVVEARPPGAGYRARKFVRRHRGKVLAAGLVVAALVAGIVGTTWGLFEARRQEGYARQEATQKEEARAAEAERADGEARAKVEAQDQRAKAVAAAAAERKAKEETQRLLDETRRGYQLVAALFDDLNLQTVKSGTDPLEVVLARRVTKAAAQLDAHAISDPEVLAQVRHKLGGALLSLDFGAEAVPLLEKARDAFAAAHGPAHEVTLAAQTNLAGALYKAGDFARSQALLEGAIRGTPARTLAYYQRAGVLALVHAARGKHDLALPLHEEVYEWEKAHLAADPRGRLPGIHNLSLAYLSVRQFKPARQRADEALDLARSALGPDDPQTIEAMQHSAECLRATKQIDAALARFDECLRLARRKLGADHPVAALAVLGLGTCHRDLDQFDKALPHLEEAVKLLTARFGPTHPQTLVGVGNLAGCYRDAGQAEKALPLLAGNVAALRAKFGADHPTVLAAANNHGLALLDLGRFDQAAEVFAELYPLCATRHGADHPLTVDVRGTLAFAYQRLGRLDLAMPLNEEVLAYHRRTKGPDDPETLRLTNSVAAGYRSLGRLDKSVPLFEDLVRRMERQAGRAHPNTLMTVANLGVNYLEAGRLPEAVPLLEEAYRASERNPPLVFAGVVLMDAHRRAGRPAEALKLSKGVVARVRASGPPASLDRARLLARAGAALVELGAHADAEPVLREALAAREKGEPTAWGTADTRSVLGEALLGQKKYADAEPLLVAGYDGLKQREKSIPPPPGGRVREAIDRLVELYATTARPTEAAKWRAERAKYPEVAPPPRAAK